MHSYTVTQKQAYRHTLTQAVHTYIPVHCKILNGIPSVNIYNIEILLIIREFDTICNSIYQLPYYDA